MLIAHRINTVAELKTIPCNYGVEVDLRDCGEVLALEHDPFSTGEDFDDFLSHFNHAFIILNVKSERIELRILDLLRKYKVCNYFFLDCSFPMVIALARAGERRIALRFSEYESLESIRLMKEHIQWVWVDCFTRTPLTAAIAAEIALLGLKTCLVSPELQGRPEEIDAQIACFVQAGVRPDMVCSKLYNLKKWQILFN